MLVVVFGFCVVVVFVEGGDKVVNKSNFRVNFLYNMRI